MNIVEKAKELGYKFREDENQYIGFTQFRTLRITNPQGIESKNPIPFTEMKCYFAGAYPEITPTEAKKLAAEGQIPVATGKEVYRAFHSEMTDEEFEYLTVRYSRRAKNELDAEKTTLHYVGFNAGWDEEKFSSDIETVPGFLNSSKIEIGLAEAGDKWCAQYSYQTDIDDYCCERHYFSKKPTEEIVRKVVRLNEIVSDLEFSKLDEYFTCWECGRKVFWLDCADDIYKCAEMARDRYCGC